MPAGPSYLANGTIQPSTAVKIDSSKSGFYVIACSAATDKPVGVAQEGSYDAPGLTGSATDAARQGLPLRVYTNGDQCLLKIGSGGCTAGDVLVSDANGAGVTEAFGGAFSGTPRWTLARALETASSGEYARVFVDINPFEGST